MPRFEALLPGQDPIHDAAPPPRGPTLRGCLVRIGVVATVIMAGLGLFLNAIPKGEKVVIWLSDTPSPVLSSTPGDYTRTPTPSGTPTTITDTPTPLPTRTPSRTPIGTNTSTPVRWGICSIGEPLLPIDCTTLNDSPWYNATYAIAQYRTAVAPLTPSNTPTSTRTPTRTVTPKPVANRRIGGGSSGAAPRAANAASPLTALGQAAVKYETAIPPVPATIGPTFLPQPNCAGGLIGILSNDPNATPYQITTTPIPECAGLPTVTPANLTATAARDQSTPQFLGTAPSSTVEATP
jgi:hypothetical protein